MEDISKVKELESENHTSTVKLRTFVDKELREQINLGHYIVTEVRPIIVSPLGAIQKESGEVRLIHDASRPMGEVLNDYSTLNSVQYQTLEDACTLAKPNTYLAKVDLKSAYRSVPISVKDYALTGIKWRFEGENQPKYMFDTRLLFGSRNGPNIFNRLTQAVKRAMASGGYSNVVVFR